MTPGELQARMQASPEVFKMTLGSTAEYEEEALSHGCLVFASEARFYEAVVEGDEAGILAAGQRLRNDIYPSGGVDAKRIGIWKRTIETFRSLPAGTLVVHWETKWDRLCWGLTSGGFSLVREQPGHWGQPFLVFHMPLDGGWRRDSVGGVRLSSIHPCAKDLSINRATLNVIRTDPGYFRALITDADTSPWEARDAWRSKAKGWVAEDRRTILAAKREERLTPLVRETADFFEQEIARMAATALHTAAYANGQTVEVVVKEKEIGFDRAGLEAEISALLARQDHRCALTGYLFKAGDTNPHLRTSLDRIDSGRGYVAGNLQVVTRAANFFKSASDAEDWARKVQAMEKMALAMQQARKAKADGTTTARLPPDPGDHGGAGASNLTRA